MHSILTQEKTSGGFPMNDRIAKLIAEAHAKDIFPEKVSISYDPFDEKLAEPMMIAKRLTEYMKAQPPGFGKKMNSSA